MSVRRQLAAALLAAVPALAGAAQPRTQIELAPGLLGVDELATLTIEVASDGFGTVKFEPHFRLENLEIAAGPASTQSQSWINGRTSSSTRLVWRLRPLAEGPAAVLAATVEVAGQRIALADQRIEVVREAPPGRRAPPAPVDPFGSLFAPGPFATGPARPATAPKVRLAAEVDRPEAWVGEQIRWRLVLETQTDIAAFNPRAMPDFRGFWVSEIPLPERLRPEWIERGGERYGRVVMLQRALFPLRAGELTVEPASAHLVARVVDAGWLGPLGRNREVPLTTRPVRVRVKPLPPAPPGFSGLVGAVVLTAEVAPATLAPGEAATLTVRATGAGRLASVPPPTLALPAGVRSFEPRAESTTAVAGGRLQTTVTWSYVLVAERPGELALPPVSLDWFDPASGAFRVAAAPALRLSVRGAPAAAPAGPPAAPDPAAAAEPAARRPWPAAAAWAIVALLALAAAAGALLRRTRGPAGQGRRRLAEVLAAARREASPRRAAQSVEEGWRAYAWERWRIPPGLPLSQWREQLAGAGVGPAAANAFHELFDELHYLRYAPELSNVETLRQEVLDRSTRLLRDLR